MKTTQGRLVALGVAAVVSLLTATAVAQLVPSKLLAPQKNVAALPGAAQVNLPAQEQLAFPDANEFLVDVSKQPPGSEISLPNLGSFFCNGEEVLSTHWGWVMQYIEDTQSCFAVIYAPAAKIFKDTKSWTPGPDLLFVTIPTSNPRQQRFCDLLSEHLLKAGTNEYVGVHGNTCDLAGKNVLMVGDMAFSLKYPLVGNIQNVNVLAPAMYYPGGAF